MATTFEKTWAYDPNRAITPATALDLTRQQMWTLAAVLTGNLGGLTQGLWTLYASSDSVTAGTDTTDRWVLAGPYDGTKIVRASGAVAHSWIVLRSPSMNGNTYYMVLSFNSSSDAAIRIQFSYVAPQSGSITATPFSTSNWYPRVTAGNPGTATDFTINAAATDNSRISIGLTSEGDFYYLCNKQGANLPNLFIICCALKDYYSEDQAPIYTAYDYAAAGVLRGLPAGGTAAGIVTYGASRAAYNRTTSFYWANGIATLGPGVTATDSDFTASSAITPGNYASYPCYILHGDTVGQLLGIRGRLPDIAVCPYASGVLAEGTDEPTGGPTVAAKAGALWLPTNAAFNFA